MRTTAEFLRGRSAGRGEPVLDGRSGSEKALRRRCRDLVRMLDLSRPIDPVELVQRLGEHRNRPLVLKPRTLPGPGAFGLLVPLPDVDVVVYPDDIAPEYQAQIVYHEVMHLCLGHLEAPVSRGAGSGLDGLPWGGEPPRTDADGATHRSLYERQEEWEAETGATILSAWSVRSTSRCGTGLEATVARALGGRRIALA